MARQTYKQHEKVLNEGGIEGPHRLYEARTENIKNAEWRKRAQLKCAQLLLDKVQDLYL